MAVEMFEKNDGTVLINEIAPRVHNSGHIRWGLRDVSFETAPRAVGGPALGRGPRSRARRVMINLTGDLWKHGEPAGRAALHPRVKLFLITARPNPRRPQMATPLPREHPTALSSRPSASTKPSH